MYLSKFGQSRKRKLEFDTSRKISEKYKHQRLMTLSTSASRFILWSNPTDADICLPELKRLCSEYNERLVVNDAEAEEIAK